MNYHILSCFLVLLTTSGCIITSRPPTAEYVLTNALSVQIRVEAFDRNGQRLISKSVAPNGEIFLKHAERLVLQKRGDTFEFALPSNLRFRTSSQSNRSELSQLAMGGQWRIAVGDSNGLEFINGEGSTMSAYADNTKPPLGFPIRPRGSEETFEQYKAKLDELPQK